MKSDFIAGFVKAGVDKGLQDNTIASIFKLAMGAPQVGQMFKDLPNDPSSQGMPPPQMSPPQQNPQALAMQQMLQQHPQGIAVLQRLLAQKQMGQSNVM